MGFFDSNTSSFRAYVPVSVNYTMDDLIPFLDQTADRVLTRFLGDAITAQLSQADGNNPETASAELARAVSLAKRAVAGIGFASFIPFAEVQIDDSGISVAAREGRKPAYDYQTLKLERALQESGWRALDDLVQYVAKNPDTFPSWPDSPYFEEYQELSFKTPAEFSRFYPIQNRWLTFWAIRPFLDRTEQLYGDAARERIKGLGSLPEPQQKDLNKKLCFALAYQTMLEAIPNLSVEVVGANVQVNYATQYGNALYFQPPGKDLLNWVLENLGRQATLAWDSFNNAVDKLAPVDPSGADTASTGILDTNGFTML
jgi:hypothetical protein